MIINDLCKHETTRVSLADTYGSNPQWEMSFPDNRALELRMDGLIVRECAS